MQSHSLPPEADDKAHRLRGIAKAMETMQIGVTITDTHGKILYTNRADAEMHGYRVDELLGQHVRILASGAGGKTLSSHELSSVSRWRRESLNSRKDGSLFPVQLMSDVVLDESGLPIGIVTSCEDITERKRAEAALSESEERYALAVRGANDGLWDWDIASDRVFYSPRWKAMLGFAEEEIGTAPLDWLSRINPDDVDRVKAKLNAHLSGETSHFECEYSMVHKDGKFRWMLSRGLAVRDRNGKATRMAGSLTDITDRKVYDPLTDLPNRALFIDCLGTSIRSRKRRSDSLFGVLFLDLDHFKVVNDSLGHGVGDQLLVGISRRLEKCVRPDDKVARLGGDEFAILLDDIKDISDATRVADRIHAELVAPFFLEGHEILMTASIGIALSVTGYDNPDDVLRDADTALYRAKALGRARHEIFDTAMHDRAIARLEMEECLRHALERKEMRLVYQPLVNVLDGRIIGFEALLRWQHPKKGLLLPADFLDLAEETGLIVPIGRWVLFEACRQALVWQQRSPSTPSISMHVNLSRKQFTQPDLLAVLDEIFEKTALDRGSLHLELVEELLMEDAENTLKRLEELQKRQVRISIDRFGTGRSSLSVLQHLPITTLKIDRSFVIEREGRKAGAILQTVSALARSLGLDLVAGGVETQAHFERLRELGFQTAQGNFLGRPLEANAASKLLKQPEGPKMRPGR
jgi:diguanylate cyclase (GGDEF)-like protein/PAS domain S-box-containing protein